MALKHKVSAEEHGALADVLKQEYVKQDDGSFVLSVEGGEDVGALKRAKEHEVAERKKIQDKLTAATQRVGELETENSSLRSGKSADTQALEASWQKKLADTTRAHEATLATYKGALEKTTLDTAANEIAAAVAGANSPLLLPHVRARLRVELDDKGMPQVRVLDESGNVSATTREELQKSFLTNPIFATVAVGSEASGGGAAGAKPNGGAAPKKKLSEMNKTEQSQLANQNPQLYDQMVAAEAGEKK